MKQKIFSSSTSTFVLMLGLGLSVAIAGISYAQNTAQLVIPTSLDNADITIKRIYLTPDGVTKENAKITLDGTNGDITLKDMLCDNGVCALTVNEEGKVAIGNPTNTSGGGCDPEDDSCIDDSELWKSTPYAGQGGQSAKNIFFSEDPEHTKVRIGMNSGVNLDSSTKAALVVGAPVESRKGFNILSKDGFETLALNEYSDGATVSTISNNANTLEISSYANPTSLDPITSYIMMNDGGKNVPDGLKVGIDGSLFVGFDSTASIAGAGNADILNINGTTRANAYYYNSDARYKSEIKPLVGSLANIRALHGYSYYNKLTQKNDIGVIAQEVEKVFPDLVQTDLQGYKTVSYGNLVAPLIEAVKTLANSIDHLSNTINTLYDNYFSQQQQINDLLMRVGELESK